jgi:hypothetical protein
MINKQDLAFSTHGFLYTLETGEKAPPKSFREGIGNDEFLPVDSLIQSLDEEMSLKSLPLIDVIDGKHFKIPSFQRNYSWEIENQQDMWSTITKISELRNAHENRPNGTYFGNIYISGSIDGDEYEVIDGQQRLTTIGIIMYALSEAMDRELATDLGAYAEYLNQMKENFLDRLLYGQGVWDDGVFIELNEHDNSFFELLFMGGEEIVKTIYPWESKHANYSNYIKRRKFLEKFEVDEALIKQAVEEQKTNVYFAEPHRRLLEARNFYKRKIAEFLEKHCESRRQRVWTLSNMAMYVLYNLRVSQTTFESENKELRIQVFQSLNDRGLQLSSMDKIRARIAARFQDESDEEEYIEKWSAIMEKFGQDASELEEFLVNYLAATEKEFQSSTAARNGLLEAFRLRETDSDKIQSRLARGIARDTIDEIDRFSDHYIDIEIGLGEANADISVDTRKVAERILDRLETLRTSIWKPYVLYLYDTVEQNPGNIDIFLPALRTLENVMCRIVISDLKANDIEQTFPKAAHRLSVRNSEQGELDQHNVCRDIVEEAGGDGTGEMFGETFAENLISKRGWRNNRVKVLLWKLMDEDFQRLDNDIVKAYPKQDSQSVHLEHVFPQTPTMENRPCDTLAWLKHFFAPGDVVNESMDILEEQYAEPEGETSVSGSSAEVLDKIREKFCDDLGNMMLLSKPLNEYIKNSRFAVKFHACYHMNDGEHKHGKHLKYDLEHAANEYFSVNGAIDYEPTLWFEETPEPLEAETETQQDQVQELNEWWTWERSKERKISLVKKILDSLRFDFDPDEFKPVQDNCEQIIDQDFESRFRFM